MGPKNLKKIIKMHIRFTLLASLFLLTHLSGCVYSDDSTDTIFEGKRQDITFESEEAQHIFLSKTYPPDIREYKGIHHSSSTITVPFLISKHLHIFNEANYYNYRIREADINNDALITLKEATSLGL